MAENSTVSRRLLAREPHPRSTLPYARHVDEQIIALDTGALMVSFAIDGASFETADVGELNNRHDKLNSAWRNLADDRLAVWHHIVRRPVSAYPQGEFRSAFARELDDAYRRRLASRRMFVNDLYLTLVLHPDRDPHDRARAFLGRLGGNSAASREDDVGRLYEVARDLTQHLGRYNPRQLGIYEHKGLCFSEPMGMLRLLFGGAPERMPLVQGHLGEALYSDRVIFGREALEIRTACQTRFGAMLAVKEYPAVTRPGHWDELLQARFPFVAAQSFTFLSKSAARGVMERKQNQMVSARDRAASQISALSQALDDLASNRFVMGDHQASVLVFGDSPDELGDATSQARAMLADSGLVVAREDLGLESAFWAQFPGLFSRRTRPAAITSRNFSGLAPLHTYPAGRARGNCWGEAVSLLQTTAGSPFYFNFHVADLGHTFICGPSGSGKTVIQNFLLAQLEKHSAQQVFIDKDRGAEIFVRACGGSYLSLRPGRPTGLAPFKVLPFTPANQVFLCDLIRRIVTLPGERLGPGAEHAISTGIAALAALPAQHRSIGALRTLLGHQDIGGIGARLERWASGGALGWALDGAVDTMALEARLVGFDMTELLDHPEIRNPVMMYLFHRISGLVDGRRLVLDIDEFWKALGDEAFRDLAQNGLKTWRKQNAFMIFGTQSPADVLRSPIAHTVVEMCATKIFLPNPHGAAQDYVEGFGLTGEEFRLIRDELSPEQRRFLVKQGHDSIVVELDLNGMEAELAVLSGRTATLELMDQLMVQHGERPEAWLPHFHDQWRHRV
ncbi:MAG: VirB4 family type IV secretion/conjugal transfer ATPase [Pseudomonadota bacterium]|uniref:VirB4 family type IV secretion/conjugal transfer ATPase n=1 Tax=Phenylobacterium sp. TaxID=1871053 RepID=UPI0025EC9CD4|nr:VirB4 family type IV secretion/conjugal transfer ATPase [Phenylobacterium sp.]MBT9471329.1 VirB4 family type IV secretion/conjugal transfer ATPase [Phenylobacterium sp.]